MYNIGVHLSLKPGCEMDDCSVLSVNRVTGLQTLTSSQRDGINRTTIVERNELMIMVKMYVQFLRAVHLITPRKQPPVLTSTCPRMNAMLLLKRKGAILPRSARQVIFIFLFLFERVGYVWQVGPHCQVSQNSTMTENPSMLPLVCRP